jgi:hypothetical protein
VAAAEPDDEETSSRSTRTSKLWAEVRMDPVEIALPGGVGYTLRAYRSSTEIEPREVVRGEEDLDDFDAASAAVARRRRPTDDDEHEADEEEEEEEDEEEEDEDEEQEVPVFLGRNGRVFLFHSQEKLVEFVKSGAEHDLSQVDTWSTLVKKITKADVVPLDEDVYELDLVVENLRGGPDAWDAGLILKAGEIARDLGFALRLEPVMIALSAGTPLDDLDEALRSTEGGGVGSFFAKRKLKKIPAQQSSLAWRTIIGKISAAAEWQD